MTTQANFNQVFEELKGIVQAFEPNLVLVHDTPENYYLNTPYSEQYKKELMFAAVQINKNYVSYHFFPVYVFPDLLDGLSDKLKKRMQGKACFNFKVTDRELIDELNQLTHRGFERFAQGNLVRVSPTP